MIMMNPPTSVSKIASRQEFCTVIHALLCLMLNKRVENGYVGNAFPLSFGAFSMVLAWWLWRGVLGAPRRAAQGREPATGGVGETTWLVADTPRPAPRCC